MVQWDAAMSPGSDDSPRAVQQLAAMETQLNARLDLLDRLKRTDLHTACWKGDAGLVQAHLDAAAERGRARARKEARSAEKRVRALEREAGEMARGPRRFFP